MIISLNQLHLISQERTNISVPSCYCDTPPKLKRSQSFIDFNASIKLLS